jgi:TolB-like protein/DNA-binding winged helix-turn-helix (wHTH) protein/rhodanese-related sulfurtransferase
MPTLDAIAPLRFGRFLLEPARRLLSIDNQPVQLSSRAFDILALLAENRHRIVSKDEIFATVWRGVAVEDNNLAVQMSALRRALGEPPGDPKIILTIPGRGYRFIAPIADPEPARPSPAAPQPPPEPSEISATLPHAPTTVVKPSRRALWPALAAALVTLPVLAWLLLPQFREPPAPRLSIVVLPFRNLSADPQQDYLADAISDDLTTDLSHIPGSVVIARESADVYKGKAVGAETIGRALHVRYLLEGSLMPEGDALHVNAQLIDTRDGTHLWAKRFDATRDTLGRAQSEIVAQIASALSVTLVQVEAARSTRERPNNPDATDLYVRARAILTENVTLPKVVEAQSLLENAIRLAPNFSDALAQLGTVLLGKIGGFDDPSETQDYTRAQSAIRQALLIEPSNPIALTADGMLAAINRHCDLAVATFQKALNVDASQVLARKGIASCAQKLGDMTRMIEVVKEIRRRDPSSSRDAIRQHQIGMGYLMLGRPHDAVQWLTSAGVGLVETPGAETALGWQEWRRIYLIAATWLDGKKTEATQLYVEYERLWPRRSVWQVGSYDTHALASLPGNRAYLAALASAGMPYYNDEKSDFGVKPRLEPFIGSDLDPTPTSIARAKVVTARELHDLIQSVPSTVLIDFGRGAGAIPNAILVWANNLWDDDSSVNARIAQATKSDLDRTVVVMGNGPFGWSSYNAALDLVAKGFKNVLWFRGGEEAWVAAGYPAEDRRSP